MNKKLKGFSLAELLISLLIISIILSAAIPTLTRKSGANREYIWKWSVNNNSAYFGVGANQSAIIGFDRHPINDQQSLGSIINDTTDINDVDSTSDAIYKRKDIGLINLTEVPFSIYGDKLVLLKKPVLADNSGNESNFTNSHISFFTAKNSKVATTDDIKYAGRLALDPGNIALGIGSLQNQKIDAANANAIGENTAIGHFSLLRNKTGMRNTALGKKTLTSNEEGGYNTAVGFGSLFELGSEKLSSVGSIHADQAFENTAVGALSQQYNNVGKQNTSIGSQSLRHLIYLNGVTDIDKFGNNANTALGWASMFNLTEGQNNTSVGAGACRNILRGNNNICIGTGSGYNQNSEFAEEDNYGVYIGSSTTDSAPLISGHSKKAEAKISNGSSSRTETFDQELIINAKKVAFRPYNGSYDIFRFDSNQGIDGYGGGASTNEQSIRLGYAYFNLRDTVSGDTAKSDTTSVTLAFSANDKGDNKKTAYLDAVDKWHTIAEDALSDISFNRMLLFKFPQNCAYSTDKETCAKTANVLINAQEDTYKYPLVLNEKIIVKNQDLAPKLWIQSGNLLVNSQDDKTKLEIKVPGKNESGSAINSATSEITIQQNETTNKFMIFQGSQADSSPRIQLDKGTFFVQDVDEAHIVSKKTTELKSDGSMYIEGSANSLLKFTGNGSDVCAQKGCINELVDKVNSLSPTSDIRLKNVSGDNRAGLKEINALEVKNYTYKNDKEKTPHVGVIAQQLQKIFPDAVTKDDKGYLRIRTEDIFYAMVNSIKDLFKQLQDLTAKVTGLDKRITELEKQNKLLTEQNKAFEKRLQKLEKQSAKTK